MAAKGNADVRMNVEPLMRNNTGTVQPVLAPDTHAPQAYPPTLINGKGFSSSSHTDSALHRLIPIEGLRAYLALWVLIGHALWESGYRPQALSGLSKLILSGEYAVDLFIIISGFVIFLSLDKQRETYQQFIVRRFFRLFPVFIVLFALAIPLSQLSMWNVTQAGAYLTPDDVERLIGTVGSWWENIQWHLPLHLVMLHGMVPEVLLANAPSAFLIPAWSVSLEWQFYLVAPLAYALAVSSRPFSRLGLCAVCLAIFMATGHLLPSVSHGAALPFKVELFFLGAASYFVYRQLSGHLLSDISFPVACSLAVFLFVLSGNSWPLIPVVLWVVFLGLILEQPTSFSSRLVSPLLTNPFVRYLGRISYSMYLSHILVIIVIQHALLMWVPQLSQTVHAGVLLACTTVATLAASAGLYRFLETPGIQAGRALALRLVERQAVDTHRESSLPRQIPERTLARDHQGWQSQR